MLEGDDAALSVTLLIAYAINGASARSHAACVFGSINNPEGVTA
jgi:hypothetical protein